MNKKFNPKIFNGKKRAWIAVTNTTGVFRLWIWNAERNQYFSPEHGKLYVAKKTEGEKRHSKSFSSFDEARNWRCRHETQSEPHGSSKSEPQKKSISLGEVIENWKVRQWGNLRLSTRVLYENRLTALDPLLGVSVESITPATIDDLFAYLRSPEKILKYKKSRTSFDKEIELLKTILNWYRRNYDDACLELPFRERHKEMIYLRKVPRKEFRYMDSTQMTLFLKTLRSQSDFYFALAVTQIFQILRVSEVCAMKYGNLDRAGKTYRLSEHFSWVRKRGYESELLPGTKSSPDVATLPLRAETLAALDLVKKHPNSDLIFHCEGEALTYRKVQAAYNHAFEAARLPFSATHTLRHTGATSFYGETGDLQALSQMGHWSNSRMAEHYGKVLKNHASKIVAT